MTRTLDRRIRNPLLYPAELRAQLRSEVAAASVTCKFSRAACDEIDHVAIGLAGIGLAVAFALLRTENRKENNAMNSLMVIVPYKIRRLVGVR